MAKIHVEQFACLLAALLSVDSVHTYSSSLTDRGIQSTFPSASRWANAFQRRSNPAPRRQCGQIIGTMTTDEMKNALNTFVDAIIPVEGNALVSGSYNTLAKKMLGETVIYDVEGRVLCGSCRELLEANMAILNDNEDGFLRYCGPDQLGYEIVHSGLLLIPLDPTTGEPVMGKVKGSVFFRDTTAPTRATPSEAWPANLTDLQTSLVNASDFVAALGDLPISMTVAASGAVAILPDYIGFGQSYESPRSFLVKSLYQQAAVSLWLTAQHYVFRGCTVLDNQLTTAGFFEGGYAAFASALALSRQNMDILYVYAGGTPFRLARQLQWAIGQFDRGAAPPVLEVFLAYLGNAYSSTNYALPNTGVGQDLLSSNWTSLAQSWISEDLSISDIIDLVPSPDTPQMLRQDLVTLMQAATANGITDPCSLVNGSSVDKLCQALMENELYDDLVNTAFRVFICQSIDDTAVPIDNTPDVSVNEYLSIFTAFGVGAVGDHETASKTCGAGYASQFSPFNTIKPANAIEPLDTPNMCESATAFSISIAPTPAQEVDGNQISSGSTFSHSQWSFPVALFLMILVW